MEIKKCSVLLSISTGVQVNFSVCRITCYITRLDIDKYSKLVNWVLGGRHMDATLNMVIWQSGHTHRFITTSSDSTHDPVKGERSHPNLSLKPLWYYPCKLTPRSYGRLRVGQSECILNRNGVTSSHPCFSPWLELHIDVLVRWLVTLDVVCLLSATRFNSLACLHLLSEKLELKPCLLWALWRIQSPP